MNAHTMKALKIGTATLLASLLLSQSALAEPPQPHGDVHAEVSRTIDGSGFDVSTPAGANRLYRRIVSTAKSLCWRQLKGLRGVARAKYEHRYARPCFNDAVDSALAQVAESTGTDLEQIASLDGLREDDVVASR